MFERRHWATGKSSGVNDNNNGKTIRISFDQSEMPAGKRRTDSRTFPALSLSVFDQGIGILEAGLESVFDKFVQSSKTKTGAGGTGLGLAICKQILTSHGGHIVAGNNPGGGAVFTLTLPRRGIANSPLAG